MDKGTWILPLGKDEDKDGSGDGPSDTNFREYFREYDKGPLLCNVYRKMLR